jgi:hypothetical protein
MYSKIEQVVVLTIVTKPWCHMKSWCPLQRHSVFCDQVVINIVKNDNNYSLNKSQNPRCVVVIVVDHEAKMATKLFEDETICWFGVRNHVLIEMEVNGEQNLTNCIKTMG